MIYVTAFKRNFDFDDDYKRKISANIRKYRKEAGLTQEQLAVDIERSYDFMRRLEFKKGELGCSLETLYRISIVLGQPMDNFFKEP